MNSPVSGACSAFKINVRAIGPKLRRFRAIWATHARLPGRLSLDNVKSIISVSLDLTRTALMGLSTVGDWGAATA
jgi:hypothetical protein